MFPFIFSYIDVYFVEARDIKTRFVSTIIVKCRPFCSVPCNVTIKIFYIFFVTRNATMPLCWISIAFS